jgi:hypothetical protein
VYEVLEVTLVRYGYVGHTCKFCNMPLTHVAHRSVALTAGALLGFSDHTNVKLQRVLGICE